MLRSTFFIPTLREDPKEAEILSHKLLLRSGCIRQVSSGIYAVLPLGKRVLKNIIGIITKEMDKLGASELLFPLAQPADLWISSGRWQEYGKELLRFNDRLGRNYALSPTHEEVCTSIVSNEIQSYKQLPLILYQVHWKFRDEIRPRYGLLRCREFLMKDAYSFHSSFDDLDRAYNLMYKAYSSIFSSFSLDYIVVDADTGSIGGSASHEFMVKSSIGEDTLLTCSCCDYSANVEKAVSQADIQSEKVFFELQDTLTPNVSTIEELCTFLSIAKSEIVKSVAYIANGDKPILVCIRGDRTLNEIKLKNALNVETLSYATDLEVVKLFNSSPGFIGPINLPTTVECIVDSELQDNMSYVIGANKKDTHFMNFVFSRDCSSNMNKMDVRIVEEGDLCVTCGNKLQSFKGIEVGHIFKLGTKYSSAMNASFLNANGVLEPFIMGCYGIGVTRLLAAIIEQHNDKDGIVFPMSIAPFMFTLITLDDSQEIRELAKKIYDSLSLKYDVLYDDRNERAGVKLKDADLIGIPVQIVIGHKGYSRGVIEYKIRQTGERFEIPCDNFVNLFIDEMKKRYPDFIN